MCKPSQYARLLVCRKILRLYISLDTTLVCREMLRSRISLDSMLVFGKILRSRITVDSMLVCRKILRSCATLGHMLVCCKIVRLRVTVDCTLVLYCTLGINNLKTRFVKQNFVDGTGECPCTYMGQLTLTHNPISKPNRPMPSWFLHIFLNNSTTFSFIDCVCCVHVCIFCWMRSKQSVQILMVHGTYNTGDRRHLRGCQHFMSNEVLISHSADDRNDHRQLA